MGKTFQVRDQNIVKGYKRELNLDTKVVKDKSKYTRKEKYKTQTWK